jgi:hypothetical protein
MANPPDRYRFDIAALAKEISATLFPDDPIAEVRSVDLQDCEGALLPSDSRKRWGIYVNQNGSPRRRRFTAAHEGQSLSGASFTSLKQLEQHIDAYVKAYNGRAEPFV